MQYKIRARSECEERLEACYSVLLFQAKQANRKHEPGVGSQEPEV
jgi:hypothetical protein